MNNILPPTLQQGDLVALIAPAGRVEEEVVLRAKEVLEQKGFQVQLGTHVFETHYHFAGTDEARLEDLHWALASKAKAVWCVRGGYGCARLLPHIEWNAQWKPKWLIGYSDITSLHCAIHHHLNWATLHADMPIHWTGIHEKQGLQNLEATLEFLETGQLFYEFPFMPELEETLILPVLGGNLAVYASQVGVMSPEIPHALLLEEIGEAPHRIDRMLQQLQQSGQLTHTRLLLGGSFTDCEDVNGNYTGAYWEAMLKDLAEQMHIPLLTGLPFGHDAVNFPLPLNLAMRFDGKGGLRV